MADGAITRFHISLNVSKLERSVAFFRTLFGCEPSKLRSDYAKFELDDPPLVLALEPNRTPVPHGALNHAGIRVRDLATLNGMYDRANKAGLASELEVGVECCYARQSKFWAYDPDGTLWEVYTFDGDIEHRGAGQKLNKMMPKCAVEFVEPKIWEHRLADAVPDRVQHHEDTLDEVRLQGSFNRPLPVAERKHLLTEALRVLKPNGRLFVHVLSGESEMLEPGLTGQASVVKLVPRDSDLVGWTEEAGFVDVRLIKLDSTPGFIHKGVPMRQLQLEAFKPSAGQPKVMVMYKGPFHELRDDQGNIFPRGRRVPADAALADRLRAPEFANQFIVDDLDGDQRPAPSPA
jgi:catechol 2,3-dioxygenase-like lactoylglutathione lyase family enzyme